MPAFASFFAWTKSFFRPLSLGERGERAAEKHLRRKGMKILARGFRERPSGEIDLVAADGRTVVFVEVKTRADDSHGHPSEAVDARKRRKIIWTALKFLKRHHLTGYPVRFDVVAITWPESCRKPRIEHYPAAFEEQGAGIRAQVY